MTSTGRPSKAALLTARIMVRQDLRRQFASLKELLETDK